ncbi:MAG TPA: bacillithiol biosynthesis deacetylase BshB2 [Symbiobacteriaceae bacterium]
MERHVLVIFPHPDDESFAAGGTIALHTRAGVPVTYVCATRGEQGRNMGMPIIATRESMPVLREQELREACRILGIRDLRLLGYRDKTLEFVDPEELAGRLEAIIREVRPSLLITYHPQCSVHPDHMALGAAAVRAAAKLPPGERPKVYLRAFGSNVGELGEPDVVVDVTSVLDVKMAAIAAHRSQSSAMLADLERRMKEDPALREQVMRDRSQERYWMYRFGDE